MTTELSADCNHTLLTFCRVCVAQKDSCLIFINTESVLSSSIIWKWLKKKKNKVGKSDFLLKALPKFSVGQNLILNIIKLLEMSTSFFFQHLIMKLNSGHVMPLLFSFTLWPMHFHAILIRSHTAWNLHGSHFLSDTGFMEQYGWKICKDTRLSHRCLLICIQQDGTLEAFKETSHPRHPSSSTPSPWFQVPNQKKKQVGESASKADGVISHSSINSGEESNQNPSLCH